MKEQSKCADCEKQLELGFIPDASYGVVLQSQWHRGTPADKRFLGFKLQSLMGKDIPAIKHDSDHMMPITAYRCTGCGLLKFYAREQES